MIIGLILFVCGVFFLIAPIILKETYYDKNL